MLRTKNNQESFKNLYTGYTHFSSNVKKKIKFDEKKFNDFLEVFIYLINQGEKKFRKCISVFPPSKAFYIRFLLEEKFNRPFTMNEIQRIIKDKSWQVSTRSQAENIISERTET